MKKLKLMRLPKISDEALSKIKGGSIQSCPCNCTCTSTTNNGCISGPGTAASGTL